MTRTEFMDALRRALTGSLGNSAVNGHMQYYQEYFDAQLGMGKSEGEVVAELGNPRLLAKTIIEAAKREGAGGAPEYDEVYEGDAGSAGDGTDAKVYRLPGWLPTVAVFVVVVLFVGVVGSVVSALLPVLLPLLCVLALVRFLRRR